jgi:hypothetical protein
MIKEDIREVGDLDPLQRHFSDSKSSVSLSYGAGRALNRQT